MRGYVTLDPDGATLARLVETQRRLRDALARQGVHFVELERIAPTLLAWPFATLDEIESVEWVPYVVDPELGALRGRPNDDRPAEIGHELRNVETLQGHLYEHLKGPLDPDPPKAAFVRLARVSPPSRKVGAALHGSGLLGLAPGPFQATTLTFWRQNPSGFEPCRTMPLAYGGS